MILQPSRPHALLGRSAILLCMTCLLAVSAPVRQNGEDFENLPPSLPGWSATVTDTDKKQEYRLAAKWDVPFGFSLDGEKPQEGAGSLKCEFSEDLPGMLNIGTPVFAAEGEVEISFFVRSEGLGKDGALAFNEYDAANKPTGSRAAAAKIPASADWIEVMWRGALNPDTTGVRLRLIFDGLQHGAKIWIDNITVKAVEN